MVLEKTNNKKIVVVDSSTIISCAINCIIWVFEELSNKGIRFVVPKSVKKEVIDNGLNSKRFKYEALRVLAYFTDGVFEVYDEDIKKETSEILSYANSSYYIKNNPLKILQEADAEVIALAKKINANMVLSDERTLRLLLENPGEIKGFLHKKFSADIKVSESSMMNFSRIAGKIEISRSVELVALAYSLDIFNETKTKCESSGEKNCEKELIEGLMYALKFSGCSVSFEEINDYINLLLRVKN